MKMVERHYHKPSLASPGYMAESLTQILQDLGMDRVNEAKYGKQDTSPKDWWFGIGQDMTEDQIISEVERGQGPY